MVISDTGQTDKRKSKGQVFTPCYMVRAMLDWCGYDGQDILCKHIADNSCGDGAFLGEVVHRYIRAALDKGLSPSVIRRQLQLYVHGMDNDPEAVAACRARLDAVAAGYGITRVGWRILRMDSLACRFYNDMMDYVVGNPPYVRVHHLDGITYDLLQECPFSDKGMTDLYLAFFDLAFRTLKKGGQLCYITPVSWIYSKAGQRFRQFILRERNLVELVDMGHHQLFEGVSTYTIVSRFVKDEPCARFSYSLYDPQTGQKGSSVHLSFDEACIDGAFYLSDSETLARLRQILTAPDNPTVTVKNGFATLADKAFIHDDIPDSPFTIRAVKASTGKWSKCFYPYHADGTPVEWDELSPYPALKRWLKVHKTLLQQRDTRQAQWWLYGRTQALTCVAHPKLAVNALVRDVHDLKTVFAPVGTGVYSGYYITARDEDQLHKIKEVITTPDFISYVKALKKYKSGGYYTFSARDLQQYLHHHLSIMEK